MHAYLIPFYNTKIPRFIVRYCFEPPINESDFFEIEIIGNNVPEKNIVDRLFSLVRKHKEPLDLSYHEDINDELINKICKQVKCVPPLDLFKQN